MAGFQVLDEKGDGIVIYKPIGYKKFQLCIKKGNRLNHIAVIKDDSYTEELKQTMVDLGVIKV